MRSLRLSSRRECHPMVQQVRSSKRLPHSRARLIQTRLVKIQVAAPRAPSRQDLELPRQTRVSGNVRSVPVASLGEISEVTLLHDERGQQAGAELPAGYSRRAGDASNPTSVRDACRDAVLREAVIPVAVLSRSGSVGALARRAAAHRVLTGEG